MTQRIAYLEAVVGADITNFRREMRNVRQELGGVQGAFAGIQRIGRNLTFALTAPLIGAGVAIGTVAMDFEASMRNINSIAGLTEAQFASLSDRTLEWGSSIRTGVVGAAEALYTVFSAGVSDMDTAFSIAETSALTAEAGLADLTVTTNALVASLLTYGDTSEEAATRASNALTRMVQVGVGSMEQFAGAVSNVLPAAQAAGVSIEELYGDIAFLTQRGFSAAKATTSLNSALSSMMKPTEAMSAAFRELGVNGVQDLIEQFGGLNEGIHALVGTTDGSLESISAMFNNIRGARAIFTMTSDVEGLDQAMSDFMNGLDTATLDAWEQQMMSTQAQVDLMKAALSGLGVVLGRELLPMITPIVTGVTDFAQSLAQSNPALLQFVVAAGALAAALPPLIWLFGSLANPVMLVTTGLVGLFGTVGANADGFVAGIESIVGSIDPFIDIVDTFLSVFNDAPDDPQLFDEMDYLDSLQDNIDRMTETAEEGAAIISEMEFELGSDMFIWDVWQSEDVQQMFGGDYDAFLTDALDQLGITDPRHVQAGMTLEYGVTIDDPETEDLTEGWISDFWEEGGEAEEVELPFFDRLIEAFNAVKPQLETAISGAWDSITGWVTDTGIPALDTIGSDVIDTVTGWFSGSGDTNGDTDTYGLFSGIIDDIRAFSFADTFPELDASLNELFSHMGDWIVTDGIPTFMRSLGNFSGTVATMIGEALGSIFGGGGGQEYETPLVSLTGDIDFTPATDGADFSVHDTIVAPFLAGLGDAFADADFSNVGQLLMTGLGAALVATTVVSFLTQQLLGLGFVSLVTGAIGKVFALSGLKTLFLATGKTIMGGLGGATAAAGSTGATGMFAGVVTSFVGALGLAFAGAGIGILIYAALEEAGIADDIRTEINRFFEDVFGFEDAVGNLQRDFEDGLYNLFGMEEYRSDAEVSVVLDTEAVFDPTSQIYDLMEQQSNGEMFFTSLSDIVPEGMLTAVEEGLDVPITYSVTQAEADFITQQWETLALDGWVMEETISFEIIPDIENADEVAQLTEDAISTAISANDDLVYTTSDARFLSFNGGSPSLTNDVATDSSNSVGASSAFYGMEEVEAQGQEAAQTYTDAVSTEMDAYFPTVDPFNTVSTGFTELEEEGQAVGTTFIEWLTSADDEASFDNTLLAIDGVYDATALNPFEHWELPLPSVPSVDGFLPANPAPVGVEQGFGSASPFSGGGVSGRAIGGGVFGGNPFIVGENGEELFIPNTSGTIIPHNMLGEGGRDVSVETTNEIHIHGVQNVDGILYELRRRGIVL